MDPMNKKAVVLVSGGIDSTLSVKLIQEQGIELHGLNFKGLFHCCKDDAARTSADLGIPITVFSETEDYLQLVESPRYGWGHGANPCTDCRIYMFRIARSYMREIDASFIVSGEVLGQRPNSQRRDSFRSIDRDTSLEGLLVRPLSAKLLPPTKPELEGILDRSRLEAIQGRSRKPQIELAARFGITDVPTPSTGCMLTEDAMANRIKDHLSRGEHLDRWLVETLKIGRHFRVCDEAKVVVGRNESENLRLEDLFGSAKGRERGVHFLIPEDFKGPAALILGDGTPDIIETVGGMMLRYGKQTSGEARRIQVKTAKGETRVAVSYALDDDALDALRIPDQHVSGSYRPVHRRHLPEAREGRGA
jgi:tRNA U34 2-thiouridine synthase MnmA/TrmU